MQGVSSVQITAAVYVLTMVFTLLTALGLFTRLSSILMAIGYISLHHRNPLILHSGDTLMRMSAIYLAVAPSGAACSLDRLRQLWKGGGTNIAAPLISVWPQRVIQAQVAIVYLATFWWKMYGSLWRDGTASYYPSTLHEFDRFWVPKAVETNMFVIGPTKQGFEERLGAGEIGGLPFNVTNAVVRHNRTIFPSRPKA